MVFKMQKKKKMYFLKRLVILYYNSKTNITSSAAHNNVSENFGLETVKNMNSVINMLKGSSLGILYPRTTSRKT
jgi:hypothetical protein